MGLTKYTIGELISIVDERNDFGITDFCGININKEFMPTVANTDGLDEKKYKVVRRNRFVYSGMQTGRDECIRIGMYAVDNPIIVSPAYTTFEVSAPKIILPEYFFMLFLSKEKDRLGWFLSDSSIRSNLDWERFCEIELELPPLPIQQKYVNVYNAMLANQKAYETGLEDLKLACDATIEQLRNKAPMQEIGSYIEQVDERNVGGKIKLAQGVNVDKLFIPAKRVADNIEATRIVKAGQFAYNKVMKSNGTKLPIALRKGKTCFVSGSYQVFQINKDDKLLPEYLMLWLSRDETQRYAGFISWGSTRDVLSFDTLCEIQLPVPDISVQHAIVDIYNAYIMRREINEKLKAQIKDLCPILIKGSLEEASAWEEKTR